MRITLFLAWMIFAQSAFADVEQLLAEIGAENNQRACEKMYSELGVGARLIHTQQIKPEMKNQKFSLPDQPGYRKDAMYIGIANHPTDGTHHYYLNVGKTHFSALPFFKKAVVSNGHIATNGLLFEIPVPAEVARAIEARARNGFWNRNVSCLHAVCSLLEKEGIIIQQRNGAKEVRAKIVMANLLEGKIQILGKDADPATMRLLTTGDGELAHALAASLTADANVGSIAKQKLFLYVVTPSAGSAIAVGVYFGKIYPELKKNQLTAPKRSNTFSPPIDD